MKWDSSLVKDVEAARGLATEPKIEKPTPEEREGWALPRIGNARDVAPPRFNRVSSWDTQWERYIAYSTYNC